MTEPRLVRAKYLEHKPREGVEALLRPRLQKLLDPGLRVEWQRFEKARADTPALLRLMFRGSIVIDDLFCAYFWARVIPSRGAGWIVRTYAFETESCTLLAEPLPDELNRLCANMWHDSTGYNPIVSACLGFKYLSPLRNIEFPTQ